MKYSIVLIAIGACAMPGAFFAGDAALAHDPLRDEPDHGHGDLQQQESLSVVRQLVLKFRETGDDRFLDAAWATVGPVLESQSHRPDTLVTAAHVAQSRHEFEVAKRLLRMALSINPYNDEAWLLLASIHLVRGEVRHAANACGRLREAPPLVLLTCNARVALSGGEHELALRRLQGVLDATETRRLPADIVAWSHGVAGDLAASIGDTAASRTHFEKSLSLAERTQVRAAFVDLLLQDAQYEDAGRVLEAGAPALPLLVRRFIVARHLHRLQEFKPELKKVQQEFETWIENGDWLHAREMARFFADVVERPDLARRLAEINAGLQREPEDIRLLERTASLAGTRT